jgi:hypothetical protein
MKAALVGQGSGLNFADKIQATRHPLRRGEPRPTETAHDSREDRIILSFTLLLAVLVAGFVTSLRYAQTNEALTSALATVLN